MTERLDALLTREYTTRDGESKNAYTKIGAAFATRNGGYTVILDAMPAPQDGKFKFVLFKPRDREQSSDQSRHGEAQLDDEIPF